MRSLSCQRPLPPLTHTHTPLPAACEIIDLAALAKGLKGNCDVVTMSRCQVATLERCPVRPGFLVLVPFVSKVASLDRKKGAR